MGTCTHHGCSGGKPDTYRTWPNLLTAVRTVAALVLVACSVDTGSTTLLYAALATHWVGDMADGILARRTGTETRTGATLDVVADRLCVTTIFLTYTAGHHQMLPPVTVFLVNYTLVDTMLSLAFLRWPLLSPNYFDLVDRRLYLLNWSPPAKAANAGLLAVLMVATGSWPACLAVALAQLAVKAYSLARLSGLQPGDTDGCASPAPDAAHRTVAHA